MKSICSITMIAILLGGLLTMASGCTQRTAAPPSAWPTPASEREITIFCAAGIKPAVDECAYIYKQRHGLNLNITYGGGGEVLSSMVMARSGDIYIAPEQRFMKAAVQRGAVNSDTVLSSIAWMIPVIGVKIGNPYNISSLNDLAIPGIRVVNGRAETTALGELVPQILDKAGLRDAIERNIITTVPQVNAAVTAIIMNQADAGFIWHYFSTTNSGDIEVIWIPAGLIPGVGEVQAAVSSYSQYTEMAQQFIEFLSSNEGKAIFKRSGYIVDKKEAAKYWDSSR